MSSSFTLHPSHIYTYTAFIFFKSRGGTRSREIKARRYIGRLAALTINQSPLGSYTRKFSFPSVFLPPSGFRLHGRAYVCMKKEMKGECVYIRCVHATPFYFLQRCAADSEAEKRACVYYMNPRCARASMIM